MKFDNKFKSYDQIKVFPQQNAVDFSPEKNPQCHCRKISGEKSTAKFFAREKSPAKNRWRKIAGEKSLTKILQHNFKQSILKKQKNTNHYFVNSKAGIDFE